MKYVLLYESADDVLENAAAYAEAHFARGLECRTAVFYGWRLRRPDVA